MGHTSKLVAERMLIFRVTGFGHDPAGDSIDLHAGHTWFHGCTGFFDGLDVVRTLDAFKVLEFFFQGFVASFAGDAITALFPVTESGSPAALRALAAAWQIQEHMRAHSEYPSVSQVFKVSAKIGLAAGQVHWGIILDENSRAGVYFFQGSAVDRCTDAERPNLWPESRGACRMR